MHSDLPIACSLNAAEQPRRLAEMAAIGQIGLLAVDAEQARAALHFRADTRHRLAAIVAAEGECCAFLTMMLEDGPDSVVLTIEAPAGPEAGRSVRGDSGEELKPLGIDIEAAPYVALAAVVSHGLAMGAWSRPRWLLLLAVVAAAMLVFAALDIREVFHQGDEGRAGLALLAGFVAVLHLGAAGVAATMGGQARRASA